MTVEKREEVKQQLAHARQGLRHYRRLARQLEKEVEKFKAGPRRKGQADPNLPRTTTAFWISLVGRRPKTTDQILQAAV